MLEFCISFFDQGTGFQFADAAGLSGLHSPSRWEDSPSPLPMDVDPWSSAGSAQFSPGSDEEYSDADVSARLVTCGISPSPADSESNSDGAGGLMRSGVSPSPSEDSATSPGTIRNRTALPCL